ncbi:sensor histidine kinase [Crossiella cryophila]|uniref:Anti-sigma regulatory factor (Ser/Thr protein kinase) n=1 Tax=Crossiella cryophila TaxID=43355 RepID=A0A7W7CEZ0_9PSEU|nr:sensor histidine kinase [Crossiella cryophila]MBB4679975.1 anti-sigma regulatory factor (Ser/Thr protein kinase) [Crossiella cryophila]
MTSPFTHPAVFYRDDHEYRAALVPFLAEGLHLGLPVAAAVPGDRLTVLRAALGPLAREVFLLDMTEAGRNPGRIIPQVLSQFADRHAGKPARIVGEPIWAGRSEAEYPACVQHEALINLAFAERDLTILCPYNSSRLPTRVLADARATHPVLWQSGRPVPSPDYAPDDMLARYNEPLPEPAGAAVLTITAVTQLHAARRFVVEQAERLGLAANRVPELELIATELITNALRHADGTARLALWSADGHLLCQSSDGGHLADPLAGRLPPDPAGHSGRGLWLINDLADLVRLHTGPAGSTLRVLLRLSRDRPQRTDEQPRTR